MQVPENAIVREDDDGVVNLIDLKCAINKQGKVRNAHSNDLNGILRNKGVPDKNNIVYEAENKQTKESGDRLQLRLDIGAPFFEFWVVGIVQTMLEEGEGVPGGTNVNTAATRNTANI